MTEAEERLRKYVELRTMDYKMGELDSTQINHSKDIETVLNMLEEARKENKRLVEEINNLQDGLKQNIEHTKNAMVEDTSNIYPLRRILLQVYEDYYTTIKNIRR